MITTPFTARSTAAEVVEGIDLTGRRIIVTGGASGIGAETARALAGAGAEVTVAVRNPERAELPAGVSAARLDLADLGSVRAFAGQWRGKLDALVANAGVMALPARELTPQGWEMQLATNFLGHFALVSALHDSLREGRGRVVTVSSGAQLREPFDFDDPQFAHRAYDPWVAYRQSKTADVLLAVGIGRRWAGEGITANSLSPGWIHTNLQRHVDDDTMRSLGAMDEQGELIVPDYYKTPAQGAATSVLLAASPLVDGVTGRYFEDCQESPVVPGGPGPTTGVAEWSVDPQAADRLWDLAAATVSGR